MGPPRDGEAGPLGRGTGRASKDVRSSSFVNASRQNDQASFASIEELDALIEESKDCERAIARRQLRQRRMTLNLIVYRDALEAFGRAVWGNAA